MIIKLNTNTVLAILGGLGVFAPDVAFIASFLARQHVSWLTWPTRALGFIATFFAAAPLIVPKLRAFLALLKLATPVGEAAPLPAVKEPKRDLDATPQPVAVVRSKDTGFIDLESLVCMLVFACCLLATVVWTILAPRIARGTELAVSEPTSIVDSAVPISSAKAAPVSPESSTVLARPQTIWTYDSKYGTCKGNWCLAPALAIQVFQYVPSTGAMEGGVGFTGGYGVVWHTFVDLGLAFHGGFQKSNDKPFTAQGLALFNVANYVSFGPGFQMMGQSSGPAKFQLTLSFAGSWIPGMTVPN
jgi:hypothetical protein